MCVCQSSHSGIYKLTTLCVYSLIVYSIEHVCDGSTAKTMLQVYNYRELPVSLILVSFFIESMCKIQHCMIVLYIVPTPPPRPPPPVVSGQQPAITSSLPAAFFTASSAVNIAEGSVLQLFCTADSSDAVFTWDRDGTVLTNDPPHIRIRSNSDTNTVTSILTVDGFTTADNGIYQCRVETAMATTQMLTGEYVYICTSQSYRVYNII